eukprot:5512674-Prymnesium_polylepis.1
MARHAPERRSPVGFAHESCRVVAHAAHEAHGRRAHGAEHPHRAAAAFGAIARGTTTRGERGRGGDWCGADGGD